MARSEVLRILPGAASWTLARRAKVALAAFGAIWLLVEPHFAFSPVALPNPLIAYLIMIGGAFLVTGAAELMVRQRRIGVARKLRLTVILTKAGRRVSVETAPDLVVRDFVAKFLASVLRASELSCYKPEVLSLYDNNLMVRRDDEFISVDASLTLKEAGLRRGDVCKIGGYVRVEYQFSTLHIDDSVRCANVKDARAQGRVVLDEDSASSVAEFDGPTGHVQVWVIDNLSAQADDATQPTTVRVIEALHRAGYVPRR